VRDGLRNALCKRFKRRYRLSFDVLLIVEHNAGKIRASSQTGIVPVLLYHSVNDSPAPEIADFAIDPRAFREHVEIVAGSGREPVTLGELARRLGSEGPETAENLVCVTFDDGWRDNLAAAETLAEHEVPATIYVTSGYVGNPNMVSEPELSQLAASPGIEIGAHSVTHPHLDELSVDDARREIVDSRFAIEQSIGRGVDTFAYPHGAYDRHVRQVVEDAGFTSAAAVKNALSHTDDDLFAIARWTVTSASTSDEIRSVIAGDGAPLAWRNERLRTKGFRAYRRLRHRAGRST
jgi:peptidoglycan/xylan/chitin deacetylase (PgdA/CDA1 family)